MSSTHSRIVELIENIVRDVKAYNPHKYNETQLSRKFNDPFFEELSWDVTNKASNVHGVWPIK